MYKVQFMSKNSNSWTNASSSGSEQSAIVNGKSVLKRPNVQTVRVLDKSGAVVWMASN